MSSKRKPFDQLRKLDNRKHLKNLHRERRFEPLEDRLLLAADFLEANDSLASATFLGSEPAVTLRDLTIHEVGEGQSNPDFYRITASQTGMLIVNSLFDHGQGDLDLLIRDSRGFVVATSASQSDNERLVIPVVTQQSYFVEIFGVNGATNDYALEVENFAAPTPQAVVLASRSDTGMMDNDRITADNSPVFAVQADLSKLLERGVPLLAAGSQNGAAVFVTVRDADSGIFESGYADPLGDDLFEYTATSLPDGEFIVSAAVHIFDPRRDIDPANENATIADAVVGSSVESTPIVVRIDTAVPEVTSGQMLPSSDSGMSRSDRVTNVMQPAFIGASGANNKIRILANGLIVGEGVAASDGRWEITVEPLIDGIYSITTQVEDLAGNFGENSQVRLIEVDTIAPNTPFLDLTDESDLGLSMGDDVTSDNTLEFTMTTSDSNTEDHLNEFNFKYRLYVRPEGGEEFLLYNSAEDDSIPPENFQGGFTNLEFLTRSFPELPDGTHNFKLEVEDRAGNISEDFLLNVTIDTSLIVATIDLDSSSDTGMSDSDNVTSTQQLTLTGVGDVGDRVSIYANGVLVGTGFVGSDETDFVSGDGRGAWKITAQPLDDGIYDILAHLEDQAGNFERTEPIRVEIDTLEPNTAHLDLTTASDTGHSQHDNITNNATPNFTLTTQDPNQESHLSQFNYKYRLYLRAEGAPETLLYNSVIDVDIPAERIEAGFTDLEFLERSLGPFPDGIHNLKLEVEDRAGNISHDTVLTFEVDSTMPEVGSVDLLDASDSGMSNSDNVTNLPQPAFSGTGTPGTQVRLFANDQFVGTAEVGSDQSDGDPDNGLGVWEITSEPLADGVYTVRTTIEDWAGNLGESESLQIEIDTLAPNTPFLDLQESDDTGRNNDDNVTNATSLTFSATTHDANDANHRILVPEGQNLKYRLFVRPESGAELLVYDSATDDSLAGRLDGFTAANQIAATVADLPEGLHNFKLEVEDRAGNVSHDFLLEVLIDRTPFAGTVGIKASDDTGVWGIDSTFGDGITGSSDASLAGTAEANNIVTVLIDDEVAGTTVATPFDGDEAFQLGTWELDTIVSLATGNTTFEVLFEDLAGNQASTELDVSNESSLVIDVTGPRVENVTRADAEFTSVFDPKPAGGPDPLIDSIVVHFSDGPERPAGRPYSAVLAELALEEGNYRLVGDAFGDIPITQVSIFSDNPGPGVAMTAVRLDFGVSLPDDRYTLTVFDRILDAAGNPLDGDSGANGPFEGNPALVATPPIFPTGDGNHGGDFIARFTVDSRPELGVWAGGSVYVDTNGNFLFDPTNRDYVNRDITYGVGFTSDDVFAGNFTGSETADGYDKLAAYGRFGGWVGGTFRWWIDLDNDGVVDIDVEDHADVNGLPVAGNFEGNAVNGDEVALYTGRTWHFDTDHDYRVDTALYSELIGYPVVGDFDRDGFDDLASWADDRFMVDLANGAQNGWDGVPDAVFRFGFIGVRERPVAADMDQDGFDDLGLWVPDRGGMTMRESGEWYWLVSGGSSVLDRIVPSPDPVRTEVQEIQFTPQPFGNDILAQFGDEFAIPVVGNFDPPTLPKAVTKPTKPSLTNPKNPLDVDDDGHVSPRDVLLLVNHLNAGGPSAVDEMADGMPYLDPNADGFVTARDALAVINFLNELANADAVDDIATDIAFALAAVESSEDDESRDDGTSLNPLD